MNAWNIVSDFFFFATAFQILLRHEARRSVIVVKNLQGHFCPQEKAAQQRPIVVDPDTQVILCQWTGHSSCYPIFVIWTFFTSRCDNRRYSSWMCVAQFSIIVEENSEPYPGVEPLPLISHGRLLAWFSFSPCTVEPKRAAEVKSFLQDDFIGAALIANYHIEHSTFVIT